MDVYLIIAWLISGMLAGFMLGLWFNPGKRRRRAESARTMAQEQQLRRQLDKLKLAHEELSGQLAATTQRHDRQTEVLKRVHGMALQAAEEELRKTREQLRLLVEAGEPELSPSDRAFAATRFDDDPQR